MFACWKNKRFSCKRVNRAIVYTASTLLHRRSFPQRMPVFYYLTRLFGKLSLPLGHHQDFYILKTPIMEQHPITKAIRIRTEQTNEMEHSSPLFLTSSFCYDD